MILIDKPDKTNTKSFKINFSPDMNSYRDVLKVKNLSIGYDRELCKLSFEVESGDRLGISGENGIGKSTFLKTIMGDVQAVPVEDVLNMPEIWLTSPWVGIDEEDNDEQLIDDLVTCLHLESIYEHLYILTELESNINEVDVEKVKEIVTKSKDSTLVKDISSIVQEKIKKGELTNFHTITDFEKILKCNFKKDND